MLRCVRLCAGATRSISVMIRVKAARAAATTSHDACRNQSLCWVSVSESLRYSIDSLSPTVRRGAESWLPPQIDSVLLGMASLTRKVESQSAYIKDKHPMRAYSVQRLPRALQCSEGTSLRAFQTPRF